MQTSRLIELHRSVQSNPADSLSINLACNQITITDHLLVYAFGLQCLAFKSLESKLWTEVGREHDVRRALPACISSDSSVLVQQRTLNQDQKRTKFANRYTVYVGLVYSLIFTKTILVILKPKLDGLIQTILAPLQHKFPCKLLLVSQSKTLRLYRIEFFFANFQHVGIDQICVFWPNNFLLEFTVA